MSRSTMTPSTTIDTMTSPTRLLTLDEVADILRLQPSTLREWRKRRCSRGPTAVKLTPSRQGRILFRPEEVARWQRDPAGYEAARRSEHGRDVR